MHSHDEDLSTFVLSPPLINAKCVSVSRKRIMWFISIIRKSPVYIFMGKHLSVFISHKTHKNANADKSEEEKVLTVDVYT